MLVFSVFSRPYFTKGRAVVIVLVVCLFVTDVLWLNGGRYISGCYWSL